MQTRTRSPLRNCARFLDNEESGWLVTLDRLERKVGYLGVAQYVDHGCLCLLPYGMGRAPMFTAAIGAIAQALIETDGAINGFHHLQYAGSASLRQDFETTLLATPRGDETSTRKCLQNLGEKAGWGVGRSS